VHNISIFREWGGGGFLREELNFTSMLADYVPVKDYLKNHHF
jgi:hypothetical protein